MSPTINIKKTRFSGFTITELLVVIGIIAVLAAILIPVVSRVRENALTSACSSNLRQIAFAALMHANDRGGYLPPSSGGGHTICWWHELAPYFMELSVTATAVTIDEVVYQRSSLRTPSGQAFSEGQSEREIEVYFCPAARLRHQKLGQEALPSTENYMLRTYGINAVAGVNSGFNLASVLNPAKSMLFMDGHKSDSIYYHRVLVPSQYMNDDNFVHPGETLNAVFVDGHVRNLTRAEVPTSASDPFWDFTSTTSTP